MAARWTARDIPELQGETIVVTGANGGLGFAATRQLANKGAHVVMACRSRAKAERAMQDIRKENPAAKLEFEELDLANLDSVRSFAKRCRDEHPKLDVLINNAGVMALPLRHTAQGFEMQMGTNYFGHFALTGLLLPSLLVAGGSRVVSITSHMHRMGKIDFENLDGERGYRKWTAYNQSKLANLMFAYELQRRLEAADAGTISVVCHPGYASTNLQFAGPQMVGAKVEENVLALGYRLFAQSADSGALPVLYAATSPDVSGGDYFGPRGLLELWGSPKRVNSSERSHDDAVAQKLWEISVERTGVEYEALSGG